MNHYLWAGIVISLLIMLGFTISDLHEAKKADNVVLCDAKNNGNYEQCYNYRKATYINHNRCVDHGALYTCFMNGKTEGTVVIPNYPRLSCVSPNEKITYISCNPEGMKIIWFGKTEEVIKYGSY